MSKVEDIRKRYAEAIVREQELSFRLEDAAKEFEKQVDKVTKLRDELREATKGA